MNADQTPNDEKAVTADSTETVVAGSDSSPAHGSVSAAVVVRDIVIRNLNGVLTVALKKLGASQDTIDALEDGDFEHVLWWLEAQTLNVASEPPEKKP